MLESLEPQLHPQVSPYMYDDFHELPALMIMLS